TLRGSRARRDLLMACTQLQPCDAVPCQRPRRDHNERPRHPPAASRVGADPIADLADVAAFVPAYADRAEYPSGLGVRDREGLLTHTAEVRAGIDDCVGLRDLIEPARDLRVSVEALHDLLGVFRAPRAQ